MIIMSLSTTTSIEWVMSGEYYIIVQNNILWMGDEWWVLYHCPQQHLMNGWWVVSIISLSTTTSIEWVTSGDYYIIVHNKHLKNGWWVIIIIIIVHNNILWMGDEWWVFFIVHNNILWMGDERWLLCHCPQQHLKNGWWVVSIIYHCPQQHLMNGWGVMSIISLSTTTSYEWVMSGDFYIIVHNNISWMGDEWWVLYHCPQQHLMNGWWVGSIISLSTTTS